MKKIRRKGKAEGSVLFTVVAVMMVMVVFLMSTLILTTSANRRSYYTFYENQAQYTAQGVLDAILNAANDPTNPESTNFYNWIKGVTDTSSIDVDLQGSNIPLTRTGSTPAVTATVERISDNYIWDAESASVREQNGWKITVTASVGQGRNASEYTMANYIYENPVVSVSTGVTNDAAWNVMSNLNVSTGGSTVINPGNISSNKAKAIMCASVAGSNSGNNLMCLGPQAYGLRSFPAGRGNYGSAPTSQFTNNSETVGDGIFIGNFNTNNAISFIAQRAGEGVQFWGDYYGQNMFEFRSQINDAGYPTEYRKLPYLYVDGNLRFNSSTGQEIGQQYGQPVNLYVGSINGAPQHMNGDIYMFDPDQDSSYTHERDSNLSRFISNNIRKTNYSGAGYVGGDIICNNRNLTISGKITQIGGDIIMTNPNGKLTITLGNSDLNVMGAILCAGDLEINTGSKSLTVGGGIYAKTARTSMNGNITSNAGGYIKSSTHVTDGTEYYDEYENSDTSAHFESLGGRGAEAADYDSLVDALLSGNLGAQTGSDYYTSGNNSGLDFSLFPFCSRQDEIFTHYFRWDLAAASNDAASSNVSNDALCQESIACGHNWGILAMSDSAGTKYIPYTVPKGCDVGSLDAQKMMQNNSNCFIPMLEISSGSPLASNEYYNDVALFRDAANISGTQTFSSLPKKNVKFISHKADGSAVTVDLGSTPVINKSCELDLSNDNKAYNLFIDPTQGYNSGSPLCVILKGSFMNAALNIIVNNSNYYPSGASGPDYNTIDPQKTDYADYSHSTGTPKFAGRTDVLIFFDQSIFATKDFVITTTGMYQQLQDKVYDVISNPLYPGVKVGEDQWALSADWDALYPGKDAYKFELVPNVVIYGQKGVDYAATNYSQPAFPNGFIANAEIIMPDSGFSSKAGDNNMSSITYREFTESIPYDPYSNTVNVPNSKRIISMGTILVEGMDSNNVSNLPICVYLGDLMRPGQITTTGPTVSSSSAEGANNGAATIGSKKDRFGKDHQGQR